MQRRVNRVVTYLGLRIPAGFALVLLLLFAALRVQAQTPSSLTPEQLQAFQNLAPEQQKAIMDAIGGQSTTPGTVDSLSGAQEADRARSSSAVNGERRQPVPEPAQPSKYFARDGSIPPFARSSMISGIVADRVDRQR